MTQVLRDILHLVAGHLWMFSLLALFAGVRVVYVVARRRRFSRLRQPGLPRWPFLLQWQNTHLVHISGYLTPWRYRFVRFVTQILLLLAKLMFLALLISFIPDASVQRYFPEHARPVLISFILAVMLVHSTRLHRRLGTWLIGRNTEVFVQLNRIVVVDFFAGLIPFVRRFERDPALGFSVSLEAHEQAGEEKFQKAAIPVFSDSWHVVLKNGNLAVRVATVFGRLEAERTAAAFAALRELFERDHGIDKRRMTHSTWSFGATTPRAE